MIYHVSMSSDNVSCLVLRFFSRLHSSETKKRIGRKFSSDSTSSQNNTLTVPRSKRARNSTAVASFISCPRARSSFGSRTLTVRMRSSEGYLKFFRQIETSFGSVCARVSCSKYGFTGVNLKDVAGLVTDLRTKTSFRFYSKFSAVKGPSHSLMRFDTTFLRPSS